MTRSKIRTSGAEGLTLSSTSLTVANGLTLSDGNVTMASGHGMDFAATTNSSGSMSNELLNDYEEGTWTPTVTSGGSSFSYSAQLGIYTKIGNVCRAQFWIGLAAGTMSSDVVKVGPFPFAAASSHYTVGTGYNNGTASGLSSPRVILFPGQTDLWFYEQGGQGVSTVTGTTMGQNLSQLYTVVYQVA